MKVNRNIVFVIMIIILLLGFLLTIDMKDDLVIEIRNNTPDTISDLKIVYHKIEKEIVVPIISSGESIKIGITPNEEFSENQMWISYKDDDGETYKEVIIGYFEKGDQKSTLVNIVDIGIDGKLKFEIKSDIK